MAVHITVEFTDAQWALVQAHFQNTKLDEGGTPIHHDITEEELSNKVFHWVRTQVRVCMEANAVSEAKNTMAECFEV